MLFGILSVSSGKYYEHVLPYGHWHENYIIQTVFEDDICRNQDVICLMLLGFCKE